MNIGELDTDEGTAKLAAALHGELSDLIQLILSNGVTNDDGSVTLDAQYVGGLKHDSHTDYDDFPYAAKDHILTRAHRLLTNLRVKGE